MTRTVLCSVLPAAGGDALAAPGAALGLVFGLVCLRLSTRYAAGFGISACQSRSSQGLSL